MTYTALLSLAILRDDFSRLNRSGLIQLLKSSQNEDGRYGCIYSKSGTRLTGMSSFSSMAGRGESDVRMVYTAFAICQMLNDWSGVNIESAVKYIKRCRVRIFHRTRNSL